MEHAAACQVIDAIGIGGSSNIQRPVSELVDACIITKTTQRAEHPLPMSGRIGVGGILPSAHRGTRIAIGIIEVKGVCAIASGRNLAIGQVDSINVELLFG